MAVSQYTGPSSHDEQLSWAKRTYGDFMTNILNKVGQVGGPQPLGYKTSLQNQFSEIKKWAPDATDDDIKASLFLGKPITGITLPSNPTAAGVATNKINDFINTYKDYLQTASGQLLPLVNTSGIEKALGTNDPNMIVPAVNKYFDMARTDFVNKVGRNPTMEELAATFNGANFNGLANGGNGNGYTTQAFKDQFEALINKDSGLSPSSYIQNHLQNFHEITLANNELSKFGEELPSDVIQQIAAGGTSAETAAQLSKSYISKIYDQQVANQTKGLAGEQTTAIDTLEKQLNQSGQNLFDQSAPFIQRALAARGQLRSGSLDEAFASTLRNINQSNQSTLAPLRADATVGAVNQNYSNLLRSALESGRSLGEATQFARNLLAQNRENAFTAGQSQQNRDFQSNMFNQQTAFQLAMQPKQRQPSTLDYFLQYGLPTITSLVGSGIKGYGSGGGNPNGNPNGNQDYGQG